MVTKETVKQVFAARLRHLLRQKGITQAELARGLGVPKATISGYLKCERGPQIDMLYRIAEYFGVWTDYLVGRSTCKKYGREVIHKHTGLSDDAIKALRKMNQPGEVTDEVLKLIDAPVIETVNTLLSTEQGRRALSYIASYLGLINEPLIETVNALLSTDQGRRALSYIASYLGGDFSHPFIEMQGSSAYEDDPQLVYPQRIYAKSTIGGPPILIRNEALEESALAIVSNELRKLKRQEAKKNGDPED